MYRLSFNSGLALEMPPRFMCAEVTVLLSVISKARRGFPQAQSFASLWRSNQSTCAKATTALMDWSPSNSAKNPAPGTFLLSPTASATGSEIFTGGGRSLSVCSKRLEKDPANWPSPQASDRGKVHLSAAALALLLGGIDLGQAKIKEWWLGNVEMEYLSFYVALPQFVV